MLRAEGLLVRFCAPDMSLGQFGDASGFEMMCVGVMLGRLMPTWTPPSSRFVVCEVASGRSMYFLCKVLCKVLLLLIKEGCVHHFGAEAGDITFVSKKIRLFPWRS